MSAKVRVLVVDDDRIIRENTQFVLDREGYEVVTAEDGWSALKLTRVRPPDLILCDLKMPTMSGQEFIRRYRALPAPHAPTILMTSTQDAVEWAAEATADGVLQKPFTADDLLDIVRYIRHS